MKTTTRLAIEGGVPVREAMLPYGRQSIDEDDIGSVVAALKSDWLTTGPSVDEFENAFASKLNARHAVSMSSGTAALHAAAAVMDVGTGDEVITSPLTFVASANCAHYLGAKVVFADVQPDSLNIDPDAVEAAITPRTKAIVAVDYAGMPCDLDRLSAIAGRFGLRLIEDAAHALGATFKQKPVGSISDLTTFSLHPVKHITTGEGGIVTTADPELADRLRSVRNHGISLGTDARNSGTSWLYEVDTLGWNYRLSDIQCALGLSQLRKLDDWVARRRLIADIYTEAFRGMPELTPPSLGADREAAWHLYVIRIEEDRLQVDRAQVFRALRAENIGVQVHYIPVPWHPYYRSLGYRPGNWPVAEREYERILSLPIWPGMTDGDVSDTIDAVGKVIDAYRK